jgi:hypothetical protein
LIIAAYSPGDAGPIALAGVMNGGRAMSHTHERRHQGGGRWAACAIALAAGIAGGIVAAQEAGGGRSRDVARDTRGDPALDPVREHFDSTLGRTSVPVAAGREQAMLGAPAGERLVILDADLVGRLIARGWGPPGASERVRTLVALARALREPAAVGAMQASFGTPQETGIADRLRRVADARARLAGQPGDPARAGRLAGEERALEAALAALPKGPKPEWVRTSLDVDRDGKVDAADLRAAEAQAGRKQVAASP